MLIATAELLAAQQIGLVDELIDASESEIAVEMLSEMLVEAQVRVDSEVVEQVERLDRDMGLPPEVVERVQRLKATGSAVAPPSSL